MKNNVTYHDTLNAVQATLQQMRQWGCRGFDCSQTCVTNLASLSRTVENRHHGPQDLEQVRSELGDCQRCPLAGGRTHIVFGEGNPQADLVFVGEGPGRDEDISGRPFVGAAGQLLDKIIQAMGLTRDQVYICNIIKCRPPNNRDPEPEEITACRPFLEQQLAIIKPKVICTIGAFAARTLLNTSKPISKLRGRFHDYGEIKLMPTFHPAFLLRNPDQKRAVWEDVKKIMAFLRIPR